MMLQVPTQLEVLGREVVGDLLAGELHHHTGEGGLHLVAVDGHLVARDEDGERIAPVVGVVALADLQRVVHQVVLQQRHTQLANISCQR